MKGRCRIEVTDGESDAMRMIIAIIRPEKVEEVKDELVAIGLKGMSVTQVKGFGRQRGHKEVYRGAEYQTDFIRKAKLEMVVHNDFVGKVVDVIQRITRSGNVGDGKMFILPVENAVRVRTGETGPDAI